MKLLKTKKMNIVDVIADWVIYPRHDVDRVRVNEYSIAMQTGAIFPPIRVDSTSKKIADGFHRLEAYKKNKVEQIDVELYEFQDEAELIWWSINWNAQHGLKLTKYDTGRCLNIGREYGLSDEKIAQALCMTIDKIYSMEKERVRINIDTGKPVEVKKVISNITSTHVTPEQIKAQKPFNAMGATYTIERACDVLICNLLQTSERTINDVIKLEKACQEWLEINGLKEAN
jgi:hypothetical protein